MEFIVVLITTANIEEAETIAEKIVEEKLAGCVNIINEIRSIYHWRGKIENDSEVLMIAKTRKDLFEPLKKRVLALHSYDVPEVIAVPVVRGAQDYLDWLSGVTA